jgi:hypothetical protein
MRKKDLRAIDPEKIEDDLQRLERGIRVLKIDYDRFFNGGLKTEPVQSRAGVNKLIKRYAEVPLRKYADRFHFNALVSRFNVLAEHWDRTLRSREEGAHRRLPRAADSAETLVARCRIGVDVSDEHALHGLHDSFVNARRRHGDGAAAAISYERFVRGITSQAERLRKQSGCDEIELRVVVHDRKVELKARPRG